MTRLLLKTASLSCFVSCVVLLGIWIRSYWRVDNILISSGTRSIFVVSGWGGAVYELTDASGVSPFDFSWRSWPQPSGHPKPSLFSFHFQPNFPAQLCLPFWLLALAMATLGLILQIRGPLRFNLRALLIATTFLAVALGMIACLDRYSIGK